MRNLVSRTVSAVVVLIALIGICRGQSDIRPDLMHARLEVEMALSAAPEHLRSGAAVYVLRRGGYMKVRESANGFSCLAERDGVKDTSPICFDTEGSATTLKMLLRKMQLIEQKVDEKKIDQIIESEYRSGKLVAPRRPGVAYMLSKDFKRHDHKTGTMVTVFPPHVMFYAPYLKNSDIGARSEDRGSEAQPWILNEGKPWAYVIVVPGKDQ